MTPEEYLTITDCVTEDGPAFNVNFQVDNQQFRLTQYACEDREEAEWFKIMAAKALGRIITQAHAEGYAKAIEDAARVANMRREMTEHTNEKDAYDIAWDVCCGEIAAAIRALTPNEAGK